MMHHYIFGYGSLISDESRAKTGESGRALPVIVDGIQREWSLVVPEFGMTAVGVYFSPKASCNGVIVPVPEEELPKYDEREIKYGYTRTLVAPSVIRCIIGNMGKDVMVWIYIPTETGGMPTKDAPIVQSYVDVIMTGCLAVGDGFAREFVSMTLGWRTVWINDRANPRYPRAMKEVLLVEKIDAILKEMVPGAFLARK